VLLVLLLAIRFFPLHHLNEITLPLAGARFETGQLPCLPHVWGFRFFVRGNVIELPSMKLQVAEACSGIRSPDQLISHSSVVLWIFFLRNPLLAEAMLAVVSIPIAIAANRQVRILRYGVGASKYWDPD